MPFLVFEMITAMEKKITAIGNKNEEACIT